MKICLNMIVKNEAHVLKRCLASVKGLIDTWVIVDTGSKDGTQELIVRELQDIPGELYQRPWVNFGYNRNEALQLAKDKADYLLFIDADDYLVFSDSFELPSLTKDVYAIVQRDASAQVDTQCMLLAATRLPWRWEGLAHEALICPEVKSAELLKGVTNIYGQDGCRSQSSEKHLQTIALLKEEQTLHPNDTKPIFYLAEAYKGAQDYPNALAMYRKRASMGGFAEEVFWALYSIARLEELSGSDHDLVEQLYLRAHKERPSRLEPIYDLVLLYRKKRKMASAYEWAKKFVNHPKPADLIFVSGWIYEWGLLWQYAACCQILGKEEELRSAINSLANISSLPDSLKQIIGSK